MEYQNGEEKKISLPPRIEPQFFVSLSCSLITTLTGLYLLNLEIINVHILRRQGGRRVKLTTHLLLDSRQRIVELYLDSLTDLRYVMLN